jgi:hypothetical protein
LCSKGDFDVRSGDCNFFEVLDEMQDEFGFPVLCFNNGGYSLNPFASA